MFRKLRENKAFQGTLLATPTLIFMVGLLIIPLILTAVVSFGNRNSDGGVIYTFTLDNYIRLAGYSTNCSNGAATCFDPLYVDILWRSLILAFQTTLIVILLA